MEESINLDQLPMAFLVHSAMYVGNDYQISAELRVNGLSVEDMGNVTVQFMKSVYKSFEGTPVNTRAAMLLSMYETATDLMAADLEAGRIAADFIQRNMEKALDGAENTIQEH